jgi:methylmalonyl-CoA mutase, N-terminal domain
MTIDPRIEREQIERVRAWRAAHDTPAKAEALATIEAAARGADNLLPPTLAAVKLGATVGEISDVLRGVWGEHRETLTI